MKNEQIKLKISDLQKKEADINALTAIKAEV